MPDHMVWGIWILLHEPKVMMVGATRVSTGLGLYASRSAMSTFSVLAPDFEVKTSGLLAGIGAFPVGVPVGVVDLGCWAASDADKKVRKKIARAFFMPWMELFCSRVVQTAFQIKSYWIQMKRAHG